MASTPTGEDSFPAISLQHASKDFAIGGRVIHALRDCTLTIGQGELFGLFGPNGAGKSTLIRLLCTLICPSSGSAFVCNHDVVREPLEVRRSIAVITEGQRAFHGRLTAQQNLEFFATLHDLPRQRARTRIAELLADFQLEDAANRPVQTFSSGMLQRLSLARTLLHDPPVLLLDEPTNAMDIQTADFVRHLVKDELVRKRGKTVLYTTHDLYEMDRFCDRLAILQAGRIVAQGNLDELLAPLQQQERYHLTLAPGSDDALAALRTVPGVSSVGLIGHQPGRADIEITAGLAEDSTIGRIWSAVTAQGETIYRFDRLEGNGIGRVLRHYGQMQQEQPC